MCLCIIYLSESSFMRDEIFDDVCKLQNEKAVAPYDLALWTSLMIVIHLLSVVLYLFAYRKFFRYQIKTKCFGPLTISANNVMIFLTLVYLPIVILVFT